MSPARTIFGAHRHFALVEPEVLPAVHGRQIDDDESLKVGWNRKRLAINLYRVRNTAFVQMLRTRSATCVGKAAQWDDMAPSIPNLPYHMRFTVWPVYK